MKRREAPDRYPMDAVDAADPVEATERFLEDAAADTDPPGKDEIL